MAFGGGWCRGIVKAFTKRDQAVFFDSLRCSGRAQRGCATWHTPPVRHWGKRERSQGDLRRRGGCFGKVRAGGGLRQGGGAGAGVPRGTPAIAPVGGRWRNRADGSEGSFDSACGRPSAGAGESHCATWHSACSCCRWVRRRRPEAGAGRRWARSVKDKVRIMLGCGCGMAGLSAIQRAARSVACGVFGCQIFWRSASPSPSGDQSLPLRMAGAPCISLILSRSCAAARTPGSWPASSISSSSSLMISVWSNSLSLAWIASCAVRRALISRLDPAADRLLDRLGRDAVLGVVLRAAARGGGRSRRSPAASSRSPCRRTGSPSAFTLRAARPIVWISDVSLRRKPSLSASRIATSDTSGRSSPSRSRLTPTSTSKSPLRSSRRISTRSRRPSLAVQPLARGCPASWM